MKPKMCSYSDLRGYLLGDPHRTCSPDKSTLDFFTGKNKRVTCPVCGRKMWAARRTCDDGCCEYYCVPPHKVKGWWKKGKKQSRDNRMKK
jgi:hypothetical protein